MLDLRFWTLALRFEITDSGQRFILGAAARRAWNLRLLHAAGQKPRAQTLGRSPARRPRYEADWTTAHAPHDFLGKYT